MQNSIQYDHGDLEIIARIYAQRNRNKTVSPTYVRMLLIGERRVATESAKQILNISKRYLRKKNQIIEQLIAA